MAKNSLFSSRPYGVWDRMGTTTSLLVYICILMRNTLNRFSALSWNIFPVYSCVFQGNPQCVPRYLGLNKLKLYPTALQVSDPHLKCAASSLPHRIFSPNTRCTSPMCVLCLTGLEYLAYVDCLFIKQQVSVLEAFTGFEAANKYEVVNSLGQRVYLAVESE